MPVTLNVKSKVTRSDILHLYPEEIQILPEANGRWGKDKDIAGLAARIEQEGQQTPVKIRLDSKRRPVLVFGFRRLKAILLLNQSRKPQNRIKIRAILDNCNPEAAFLANIAENRDREDLTGMDIAFCCYKLLNGFGRTREEVAVIWKRSPAWVTQHLKLLELDRKTQERVHNGEIAASTAMELVEVEEGKRESVLERARERTKGRRREAATAGETPAPRAAVLEAAREAGALGRNKARGLRDVREFWEGLTGPGEENEVKLLAQAVLEFMAGEGEERHLAGVIRTLVERAA